MRNVWIATIVACVLLVAAGCGDSTMTVSALSSPNSDLTARVGVLRGDTEAGVVTKYDAADDVEWDNLKPDILGGYVLFHLTQEATIEDTPDPSPLGPLVEALNARPYVGLEIVGPLDGNGRTVQPNYIFGTTFTLDPASNIGLVVEYVDGDAIETGEVYIGGTFTF